MQITLYSVPEDARHMTKTLGTGSAYGGTDQSPRGALDHVAPSILISAQITGRYNYAYIDTYASYYWITEISNERQNLTRVDLVRDPLTTFASDIRNCPAICARSDQQYNADYPDPDYMREQSYEIQTKLLGSLNTYEESALVPDKIYCFFVP